MPPPVITNSLLRIDGVQGLPPSPFERPNDKMDFFVLELGLHEHVQDWCARSATTLSAHADLLRQMRSAGAKATLFVESASRVLRFETSFLRILAQAGIALECSYDHA